MVPALRFIWPAHSCPFSRIIDALHGHEQQEREWRVLVGTQACAGWLHSHHARVHPRLTPLPSPPTHERTKQLRLRQRVRKEKQRVASSLPTQDLAREGSTHGTHPLSPFPPFRETDNHDDGAGTMEAVYWGTCSIWGKGAGNGPWVMVRSRLGSCFAVSFSCPAAAAAACLSHAGGGDISDPSAARNQ